jgi:hypothetical protein
LDRLKKTKRVASLLDELAKHRLAVLGADYLCWMSWKEIDSTDHPCINYESHSYIVFSIERHPGHERPAEVSQGTVPPKFAPDQETIVCVDGRILEIDPLVMQREKDKQVVNKATEDIFCSVLQVEGNQKASNSDAPNEDRNAQ